MTLQEAKALPYVCVEWVDITSAHGGAWIAPGELDESAALGTCWTSGWVVKETKEFLCVVSSICLMGDEVSFGHDTVIPHGVVKKRHKRRNPL